MDTQKRFLKYVDQTPSIEHPPGCWIWIGAKRHNGYGWFNLGRKIGPRRAHRIAYEWWVGKIPKGQLVLHFCDNRACVNPSHLFVGDAHDNTKDMLKKGRETRGEKASWSKITEKDVKAIRASRKSQDELASQYGLCQQSISLIQRRINWKHVP